MEQSTAKIPVRADAPARFSVSGATVTLATLYINNNKMAILSMPNATLDHCDLPLFKNEYLRLDLLSECEVVIELKFLAGQTPTLSLELGEPTKHDKNKIYEEYVECAFHETYKKAKIVYTGDKCGYSELN